MTLPLSEPGKPPDLHFNATLNIFESYHDILDGGS